VGSVSVGVVDVVDDEPFELTAVPDDRPVEQFTAQRADPALSERIRDRSPDRRLEDLEALCPEDLVKAVDELATTVAHQRSSSGEPVGVAKEQVAGGLTGPWSGGVGDPGKEHYAAGYIAA